MPLANRIRFVAAISLALLTPTVCEAQRRVLHRPLVNLRSGDGRREWTNFPERVDAKQLQVSFASEANDKPWTLGMRRVDVKEGWEATLNGKRLGRLFSDENDMEEVWELPPGTVRKGDNVFALKALGQRVDDIQVGEVWLETRSRAAVFNDARLELVAADEAGNEIPCRFTILDDRGALAAVGAESSDRLAVRSGVVYSIDGKADVGVVPGRYTVLCGRGFEYNLAKREVHVENGEQVKLTFDLKRVVNTKGLAGCDTHVHTFEVSRHGDASLVERMITLAGEGIDVAVATDHNVHVDYRPYLARLGVDRYVTSIIGNEVTTKYGHFNVFPAQRGAKPSNHNAPSWPELFKSIYTTPDVRVAIINHPRDVHSGFTPFAAENMIAATGKRLDNRELQANAMELINSAALQSDPMPAFHNWLTLLNRGHKITAVGSSDSHEVSRKIVGQGRSYVPVDDSDPGKIDADAVVKRFEEGAVLTSMGLLTQITVNGRARSGDLLQLGQLESIPVEVTVQGPEWTKADRVELYLNGRRIREMEIPAQRQSAAGVKARVRWKVERPPHDVHLVALAVGPGVTGLHWPIAKAYQPTSPNWRPYVFGASGAVRIDADGDGRFAAARQYALGVVKKHDSLPALLSALDAFDISVSRFAAEQWLDGGGSYESPETQAALKAAPKKVQRAFASYYKSLRASLEAQARR